VAGSKNREHAALSRENLGERCFARPAEKSHRIWQRENAGRLDVVINARLKAPNKQISTRPAPPAVTEERSRREEKRVLNHRRGVPTEDRCLKDKPSLRGGPDCYKGGSNTTESTAHESRARENPVLVDRRGIQNELVKQHRKTKGSAACQHGAMPTQHWRAKKKGKNYESQTASSLWEPECRVVHIHIRNGKKR